MENEELYHYGVKGMKWGIRKARETIGRVAKKASNLKNNVRRWRNERAITSGDSRKIYKRFTKMSNEELRAAVDRINFKKAITSSISSAKVDNKIRKYIDQLEDQTANKTIEAITNPMGTYIQASINAAVAQKNVREQVQEQANANLKNLRKPPKKK